MELENNTNNMGNNIENQRAVENATVFVEKNDVNAKEGRECVDGRYDQHGAQEGMIARAGADFGYVMGLLGLRNEGKLSLTPEECVDAVYKVVTENGGRFYAHSDEHAKDKGILSGCGHIMKSATPELSDKYGVNSQDVITALNYAHEITSHQNFEEVELHGSHEEKGVLIVRGNTKTVNHHDENDMYFVYDIDRDEAFQEMLVYKMNIPGVTVDNFREFLTKQTNATVELLAPGKPVFEVNFNENGNDIKLVDYVPTQK